MDFSFMFFFNSVLLGVGLAMDAFSVSVANGLAEPQMKKAKMLKIAGTFAFFQCIMPLAGWLLVHNFVRAFTSFERFIPYIALALLTFIGGKMLLDARKAEENSAVHTGALLVQGIATSIDALSVGFTIEKYNTLAALVCAVIIGVVTLVICWVGLRLGKRFGNRFSKRAQILGGIILIGIGLEIFIKSFF